MNASDSTPATLVDLKNITFSWDKGPPVLNIASFEMATGESVFLRGPSGSGKSTLLGLICGVLTPQSGSVCVDGTELTSLNASQRDRFRADHLGVIFQMFNLLPYLPLLANVTLPCRFSKQRAKTAIETSGSVEADALRLLETLGLNDPDFLKRPVNQLSVGQQQRAAAARALIGSPQLIIADEPTSALDTDARDTFLNLLKSESAHTHAGLLFVSHDAGLAPHLDRSVDLAEINHREPAGVPA